MSLAGAAPCLLDTPNYRVWVFAPGIRSKKRVPNLLSPVNIPNMYYFKQIKAHFYVWFVNQIIIIIIIICWWNIFNLATINTKGG